MPFGIPKKKINNVHMNIGQTKYFRNMFIRDFFLRNKRKIISKGLLKNKVQF
jgi:hypothetical protein